MRYTGFSFDNDRFNSKISLCNLNKLSNKISLVSTFLLEQTLHTLGVAETWLLPSITDYFVDISDYPIVRKNTSGQVAKHGVCIYIIYIYVAIRKDIEFEFIIVDYQNVVCIMLFFLYIFIDY